MRQRAKNIWKSLPQPLREFPLQWVCNLRAGERRQEVCPPPDAPVYIFGNFQTGGGISRSAQLYAAQIRTKHPHCICVDTTHEMLQSVKNPITDGSVRTIAAVRDDVGAGTAVIHLNPPQFQWLLCHLGRRFLQHKRIVVYWSWELESVPNLWRHALRFVDAVEVPSSFTQAAVSRHTHTPVTVVPHVLPPPDEVKETFGKDGRVRCLFVFDMASLCVRKNPEGAVEAFVRAFTPEQATLTIKVSQPTAHTAGLERLRALVRPHRHITLLTEWLDASALKRLYLEHDVYLSLHRSEGYGLTIREAMLYGLYVVATGWSGNMDFMAGGERVSPVPYRLVPLTRAQNRYFALPDARWAEPDRDEAAKILKHIYATCLGRPQQDAAVGVCP